MIAVDTSALVAISLNEPERDAFLTIIRDSPKALISTVSVVETKMVLFGRRGLRAIVMLDDFMGLRRFEITPPSVADMEAAYAAFLAFGKGSGHPAGLNFGDVACRVDFNDLRHVLREVEDHGDVAALPGQRCSSTTAQNGCAEFPSQRDRGDNIIHVARQNNSNRYLPVVRPVGRVKRAAAVVETHIAPQLAFQRGRKSSGVDVCRLRSLSECGEIVGHGENSD